MEQMEFFTIGVYGSTADSFFKKLTENNIDTFCDIRQRRGVRGAEYSFVNSKRLQDRLAELNIKYIHITELATPDAIKKIQYEADKKQNTGQRKREILSREFIDAYTKVIVSKFDFSNFINQFKSAGSARIVLFCVEKNPLACHRSIVAEHLHEFYSFSIKDL